MRFLYAFVLVPVLAVPVGCGTSATTAPSTQRFPQKHRVTPSTCSATRPPGYNSTAAGDAGGVVDPSYACQRDSDCSAGRDGRCLETTRGARSSRCTYSACTEDKDCKANETCLCNDAAGHTCTAGTCKVDADCTGNTGCSPSTTGHFCHTQADECIDDSDCAKGTALSAYCDFAQAKGHWVCKTVEAVP